MSNKLYEKYKVEVPIPEEPDSMEKFVRDMANDHLTDGEHNLNDIKQRARALIKEHDEGQKKITEMLERAQEVRVKNGGE